MRAAPPVACSSITKNSSLLSQNLIFSRPGERRRWRCRPERTSRRKRTATGKSSLPCSGRRAGCDGRSREAVRGARTAPHRPAACTSGHAQASSSYPDARSGARPGSLSGGCHNPCPRLLAAVFLRPDRRGASRVRRRPVPQPQGKAAWSIVYNDALPVRGRINFVLAHEFGHYLRHRYEIDEVPVQPARHDRVGSRGPGARDRRQPVRLVPVDADR